MQLDLTAPAAESTVDVYASVGSSAPDPVASNNSATTVTAVLPDGQLQLDSFTVDPGSGTVTLGIDTLYGVTYMLQSSLNLIDWTNGEILFGYGYPYEFVTTIDETREFFRIVLIPYSDPGGGVGE